MSRWVVAAVLIFQALLPGLICAPAWSSAYKMSDELDDICDGLDDEEFDEFLIDEED